MFTSFISQHLWLQAFVCLASSYIIGFFTTKKYIDFVHKKTTLFQPIRDVGPESHLKTKQKTATMGGIFILLSTLITTLLFIDFSNRYVLVACVIFLTFAAIGLADDLAKVLYRNTKGVRGSVKIVIQFAIICIAFLWLGAIDEIHFKNRIFLPFGDGHFIYLGLVLYVLFVNVVIVGTSNAVNLTDGLDGLVSVPAIISLGCLILLIYASSTPELAVSFKVPHVKFSGELIFFCIALIGSILAFFTFNLRPAKIFMGDVGSLAIGSVLGLIAIIVKQEFIFFVISIVFVCEAVSVILQVSSYKIRKKRIFLMAPLHHHFEKKGWSEQIVVNRFWLASLGFAALGMGIFLL
ncbi:MAG: phospho-N-acetylmuramoyl-pentapeptide-transferase [Proteobacteria bacterium]|nr:phospho-N-acetylmuramoyl-pentapeptide-transferase [Pseudomonadota bacterium]